MKIWVHGYELAHVDGRPPRRGALLKIEWAVGQVGYSDLHPWPEFGEPELDDHLQALAAMQFTPLAENSLELNYIDREFRLLKRNAFLGLVLPRSHRLVVDIKSVTAADLREWHSQGFTHVKVKMGQDPEAEAASLLQLVGATNLLWRLDFNARLSSEQLQRFWYQLDSAVRAKIDFVEDPVSEGQATVEGPWADDWKRYPNSKVRIVKPARESSENLRGYDRVIFTHGLDHPLGQAGAVWSAAKYYSLHPKKMEVGGLATPDIYVETDFSKAWNCPGPRIKPTPGFGFGFDELLETLPWERLF